MINSGGIKMEMFNTQFQRYNRARFYNSLKLHTPVQSGNPYEKHSYSLREGMLDLNQHLINNRSDTFMIRVQGNSMIKAGITPGNILIVDRKVKPRNNKIVVAAINDELTVKRLKVTPEEVVLLPENDDYLPIEVKREDKFEIWGVVTSVIKAI